MTLQELETRDPPDELPQVSKDGYTIVWISGYWYGPKSGMLLYQGREHWFEMFRENLDDRTFEQWYRKFAIVQMTPEQLNKEKEVHDDFRRYVGTHWDAGSPKSVQPATQHHLFYEKHLDYCRGRHYDGNEVVARFKH